MCRAELLAWFACPDCGWNEHGEENKVDLGGLNVRMGGSPSRPLSTPPKGDYGGPIEPSEVRS